MASLSHLSVLRDLFCSVCAVGRWEILWPVRWTVLMRWRKWAGGQAVTWSLCSASLRMGRWDYVGFSRGWRRGRGGWAQCPLSYCTSFHAAQGNCTAPSVSLGDPFFRLHTTYCSTYRPQHKAIRHNYISRQFSVYRVVMDYNKSDFNPFLAETQSCHTNGSKLCKIALLLPGSI